MLTRLDGNADGGTLDAYRVPACAEQVGNWLCAEAGEDIGAAVTRAVRLLCGSVAICKSIHVDEESRGQGIGGSLLNAMLERCSADVVLLISDANEGQADGFVLQDWYERNGFARIADTAAGPLMAFPEDVAEGILEILRSERDRAARP
jgi:GNAT superfamily N-acetyltransferase